MKEFSLKLFSFIILLGAFFSCSTSSVNLRPPVYWNYQKPLDIWVYSDIPDQGAEVLVFSGQKEYKAQIQVKEKQKDKTRVQITLNQTQEILEKKIYFIKILKKSSDGNPSVLPALLDSEPPRIGIIQSSPSIMKGGSAIVIFEVKDRNLEHLTLSDQDKYPFNIQKFKEEGCYISLVHWYLTKKDFILTLTARDKAGNINTVQIPFKKKDFKYPVSRLKITKEFYQEKALELAKNDKNIPKSDKEKYEFFMKKMDDTRKFSIAEATSKPVTENVKELHFFVFNPLKKARITSLFGTKRTFYSKNKLVRESYHLGLDLAHVPNDNIFAATNGTVIYSGYNGGNGNMLLIHHGLGLYTFYGHCSKLLAKTGAPVKAGELVAISGTTGYSLGDHLHFGVMIGSHFVNPNEWMSSKWMTANILHPIRLAEKYLLEKKQKHLAEILKGPFEMNSAGFFSEKNVKPNKKDIVLN